MSVFDDVIGHRRVLGLLRREAAAPAGAYLFVGAASVGKATVARRFAALLLCPEGGDHAGECRSCRLAAAGTHPDLITVEASGRSVGVDQARETIERATLRPVESVRKVFLFEEAGAMTEQAANALLKTLEEPTATTVFLLVAESETDLPLTVASRCRTVHFGRVEDSELEAALIARGVEGDRAAALARVAGGRPGLALTLAGSESVADFREAWLRLPQRVSSRPGEAFLLADEMIALADTLVPEGVDAKEKRRARLALLATGLEIAASWYVDAAAVAFGGEVRNQDVPLADLASVPPRKAVRNAELLLEAVTDLAANLRPQPLLARLFVELAAD